MGLLYQLKKLNISNLVLNNSETFNNFQKVSGHTILERYGMSETVMLVSNPYQGERIGGSVGVVLPGVEVRVVGDSGKLCGPDEIGGIEVRMFLDRIDQLADGRLLIIDYKTGASIDTRNWASERLTEPQLPIYAAIANPPEGDVAGVAFAQVHLSKLGFKGVGDAEGLLPGVDDLRSYQARKLFDAEQFPDWGSVLTHWKTAIHQVAEEVCAGDASVRYASDKDLMFCDVKPLLRLAERAHQLEAAMDIERRTEGQV